MSRLLKGIECKHVCTALPATALFGVVCVPLSDAGGQTERFKGPSPDLPILVNSFNTAETVTNFDTLSVQNSGRPGLLRTIYKLRD